MTLKGFFFLAPISVIFPLTLLLYERLALRWWIPRPKWPKSDGMSLPFFCDPLCTFEPPLAPDRDELALFVWARLQQMKLCLFSLSIFWVPIFVFLWQQLDLRPRFKWFKYLKGSAFQALTGHKRLWVHLGPPEQDSKGEYVSWLQYFQNQNQTEISSPRKAGDSHIPRHLPADVRIACLSATGWLFRSHSEYQGSWRLFFFPIISPFENPIQMDIGSSEWTLILR